jgi:thiamine biosynthesis lipoprotein
VKQSRDHHTPRREFLKALVPGAWKPEEQPDRTAPTPEQPLLKASRQAMGCVFEVLLPASQDRGMEAAEAALDAVAYLDRVMSTYKTDSEVSRLNAAAGLGPRPVSESLFDIIALSVRLSEAVDGAFDPTAGALVRAWGFEGESQRRKEGQGEGAADDEVRAAIGRTGTGSLRLDAGARTVELAQPGVELNFGAIGKGYALDQAARTLKENWNAPAGLIHGGTSSVFAFGSEPGNRDGWTVGIANPDDESERIATVRLRNRGLATSGAGHRFIEAAGKRLGHILDPRTGQPVEGPKSITVVARTAADSDALSTAFFILGTRAAAEYAAEHEGVGVILFPTGEKELRAEVAGDIEVELAPGVQVEEIA